MNEETNRKYTNCNNCKPELRCYYTWITSSIHIAATDLINRIAYIVLYKLKRIPKWGNAKQWIFFKKKQNNHKHSGPRTSPLPHSVQRQKQYLFLPLQLKLPPQKSDQRVYLGTTANISRLITITSNLRRGGGEESHKCFDSFLFSIFFPIWRSETCAKVSASLQK